MSSGSKKGTKMCYPFPQRVPASESPPGSPTGPLLRDTVTYRAYLPLTSYISFYLSLRVPDKGAPSMFPNRVPMGSDTPSPEPLLYFSFIHSFMYVCRSPQKGALLHTYREKHKVTVHGAPRRRKAYIQ